VDAAAPEAVVEQLLDLSGAKQQIGQIQGHVAGQGAQRLSTLDAKQQAAVTELKTRLVARS
jgi:hypothetical protein